MSVQRAYGVGALFYVSLLDARSATPGLVIATGSVFTAASIKLTSDEQGPTTCIAESVQFFSGSVKPNVGDTLSGSISNVTATVIGTILSGSTIWGPTSASGYIFVESAGTFTNEYVNNATTGDNNVLAFAGDFDGDSVRQIGRTTAIALTSAEMSCLQGSIEIADTSGSTQWLESTLTFETYGHPNALHQPEGNDVTLHNGICSSSGTTSTVALDGLPPGILNNELNNHMLVVKDISSGEYASRWIESFSTASLFATIDPNGPVLPFVPITGDHWSVMAFRRDTTPIALGIQAKTDVVTAVDSSTVAANIGTPTSSSIAYDIANMKNTLLYTAVSESYAADGVVATPTQLLYMIYALLGEFSISGTTATVKKLDASTTAMTFELDSSTTPTSMSRIG